MQLDKQNPFESISMEQAQAIRAPRTSRTSKRLKHRSVEDSTPLGDQLANVAIFPKTNRVVDNEYGVCIPRSIYGRDAEIMRELRRTGVFSPPRVEQARPRPAAVQPIDCTRELRWLAEHRDEYAGQWVALDGDRLLSHGPNAREVYQAARRSGVEIPVVVQVEWVQFSKVGER